MRLRNNKAGEDWALFGQKLGSPAVAGNFKQRHILLRLSQALAGKGD